MTTSSRIDSHDLTLAELFQNFYSVPDFQREYIWEERHVEKLLQDVYDEFYEEEGRLIPEGEYFIGSIVVYKDADGVFQLIDGQQRLTTSYLILCVIRDVLKAAKTEPPATLQGQIAASSMDPVTGDDVFRYRLVLQYEDSQGVLEKIARNGAVEKGIQPDTASVEHILNAYQTIREFLQANFQDDVSRIKVFAAAFTMRVKPIRIETQDLSSALKLFETINDRGVSLNSMDLLKNLLFMHIPKERYASLKDKWRDLIDILEQKCREKPLRFLRYFILSTYELPPGKREIREDEIYKWFSDNQQKTNLEKDPLGFVEVLTRYARAYANFTGWKNVHGHENRHLHNIARLSNQARQHFILLLAAQNLPEALFDRLTQKIENLFFCYLITREPTKNFERSFSRWAKQLREVTDEAGLESFINQYFMTDMASRSSTFDFALGELSTSRIQQYRLRYILAKLCQYVEESAWGQSIPLSRYYDSVQIEHILPVYPSTTLRTSFDKSDEYDAYKIMLGNLTLLEKSINASISNGSFAEKVPGYRQSAFLLTKSLVTSPQVGQDTQINRATQDLIQFETWTSESITTRQQILVKLARKVWEIPSPVTGG